MCGSPASSGLPLWVRLPATTQALLPSNCGRPLSASACSLRRARALRSFQSALARGGAALAAVVGQHAFGLPVEIEDAEVVGAQLIAHVGQQRFGAKRRGKAVGHVTGDADGVLSGERALGDAQHIKLDRFGVAVLILVDAVQIGLQGDERRATV